ncbi:hypothetical protein JMM51_15365 [Rhodovulum sulfidophilum]|nr:hypothetical protein [Rhodovulum sulfidophilum]
MQRGLERSFERARKGRATAVKRPEVAAIHDWRKRLKYRWITRGGCDRPSAGRRAREQES